MPFKILTVGWEPGFAHDFLKPIEQKTGIGFVHALVGEARRVEAANCVYPESQFVAISKKREDALPDPDLELLASLESAGVPTVRSMIQGDRVLRFRAEQVSLGYATLLARRIRETLESIQPDVVLASHDSLHAAMSLAVAKSLGIPWVTLAFPVIPENLTGFCKALTPDSLVPIARPVDDALRSTARGLIASVRSKQQKVVAYRAPLTVSQWIRQYRFHTGNLLRRKKSQEILGVDPFTYPTDTERLKDILRRTVNRLRLPTATMLHSPPSGRYAYYPLHMAPESMVDTWAPFHQNQLAFIAQLCLAIPADMTFVVKLHFSDPDNYSRHQLQQLMKMPRLRIAHPNAPGSAFLEQATLVVGITGTSCLEAALLGKPVLIFGDSPYVHFPRSERGKRPDELHDQIVRMTKQPPARDEQVVEAYAAYMARFMPGRVNDWTRPIEPDDMARYAECFLALRHYLAEPQNRASWYLSPPFLAHESKVGF